MNTLKLDGEFPSVTHDEWLKLVETVLKGADFNKVLVGKTYNDIDIQPLYPRVANASPEGRVAGAMPWRVDQRIDHTDIAAANAQMRDDENGGTNGFVIVGSDTPHARGFGVTLKTTADAEKLIQGLNPDQCSLRIDAGSDGPRIAGLFLDLIKQKKLAHQHLTLDIGYDPIGTIAATGIPFRQSVNGGAEMMRTLESMGVRARVFLADGRPYHEAGASEVQELAAVVSTALRYLRRLTEQGIDIEAARNSISFLLVADADEFMTVAKFRALRRLWRKVEEACGLKPKPIRIHAETAYRMMSRYDSWTNLLRATTAVFSAGIGGADAVTVLPSTSVIGLPDEISRRVARNIQLVLINEANLWRVVDPAAGAGGFETLTAQLCEKAWEAFQQIEREGGITESLKSGALQARIKATCEKRHKDIVVKKLKLTGITEFPDIRGEPVAVLAPAPAQKNPGKTEVTPLIVKRDAEDFERLRDRVESGVQKGKRERVFIAAIGSQASYSGRATFASNFFEVSGMEAVMPSEPLTPENLKDVFAKSGAKIACIASSDNGYVAGAKAISEAFAKTDCKQLYLVCSKGLEPEWNVTPAVKAVTPRSDALAVLTEAVDAVLPSAAV